MGNAADFFGGMEGGAAASPSDLRKLTQCCREALELKAVIEQIEEDLKAAKSQFHHLNTVVIPDLMAEVGVEQLVTDGWEIKSQEIVSGSLPKEALKRKAALQWLIDNGGGDLIKTEVNTQFGRDQRKDAMRIAEMIERDGFPAKVEMGVHPQTLSAFARERIKNGEPIDTDVLGIYTGKVAKYREKK